MGTLAIYNTAYYAVIRQVQLTPSTVKTVLLRPL